MTADVLDNSSQMRPLIFGYVMMIPRDTKESAQRIRSRVDDKTNRRVHNRLDYNAQSKEKSVYTVIDRETCAI